MDTSAAVKLVVVEPESTALEEFLDGSVMAETVLVSSVLTETELRRAMVRLGLPQTAATAVLDRLGLVDLLAATCHEAGILPGPHLRSLDAIHLATAIRAGAERIITYDRRMASAAVELGLTVVAPF